MKRWVAMSQLLAAVSTNPITFSPALSLFFLFILLMARMIVVWYYKKRRSGMLPVGIKVSCCSATLAVTFTAFLTFSFGKWHSWHSLSESNIFTLVGARSPSPELQRPKFHHCGQFVCEQAAGFSQSMTPGLSRTPGPALANAYLAQPPRGAFFLVYCAKPAWTQSRMWQ